MKASDPKVNFKGIMGADKIAQWKRALAALLGSVVMTVSISLGDKGLLDCLSDPDLTLLPGICLENCPFHLGFPVLLSIGFCSRI